MKKIVAVLSILVFLLLPASCAAPAVSDGVDVDLTKMSGTVVYAEVYNMVTTPEEYLGKTVRMTGQFSLYHDEETGKNYYACLIADATACCSQGIEFVLEDAAVYPDDYPPLGSVIVVQGVFDTYTEEGNLFCQLLHAHFLDA